MSCGFLSSRPKRGNEVIGCFQPLPKSAKDEGATVALFIRPCRPPTSLFAPLQEFPRTAPDHYLGPYEHPLRRAAFCFIGILVLLQVARPYDLQRVVVADVSG